MARVTLPMGIVGISGKVGNMCFRTLKINRVFDVIHSLTDDYNDKKERSDNEIALLSHLVEERRLIVGTGLSYMTIPLC